MDQPTDPNRPDPEKRSIFEKGGLLDEDGLSRRKLLKLGGMGAGALALSAFLAACSLQTATRGEACTRTLECQPRLACIEGLCSPDLSAVSDQSTVPDLVGDAAAGAPPEAPVDAMAPAAARDAAASNFADAG